MPPPPVKPPPDDDMATRLAAQLNPFGNLPVIDLRLPADLLGQTDRWEIVAGSADVGWDGAAGQTNAAVTAASQWCRQCIISVASVRPGYFFVMAVFARNV